MEWEFNIGKDFDWSQKTHKVSFMFFQIFHFRCFHFPSCQTLLIQNDKLSSDHFSSWLQTKVCKQQAEIDLQKNQNNSTIPFQRFDDMQKAIIAKVMLTLKLA